jgi:hypothetical protein
MVETVDSLRVMVKLRWALGVKAGCEGGGSKKFTTCSWHILGRLATDCFSHRRDARGGGGPKSSRLVLMQFFF